MQENQINKPVLLIGLTILFVIILSHFINGVTIFGYTVKPIDLFMDIKPDSLLSYNSPGMIEDNSLSLKFFSHKLKAESASLTANISIDLLGKAFSSKRSSGFEDNPNPPAGYSDPKFNNVPISGNLAQMKYFFDALKNSGSEKIRVAHYGDSGVEGDAITANIRQDLQKEFGGTGVGFLSITSQDITL